MSSGRNYEKIFSNNKNTNVMSWFNCKVSFEKTMPVGNTVKIQKVSESYLVKADDFTEVEAIVAKELMNRGVYIVEHIRTVRIYDVYTDLEMAGADRFYNCKAAFIILDEKAGVERRKREPFIVMASGFEEAVKVFVHKLDSMPVDYEIVSVQETDYIDLIR